MSVFAGRRHRARKVNMWMQSEEEEETETTRWVEENNNNWGEQGRGCCSICLSSPRLCCLLMTPPNVHLRSSLFRWALCRLVTDGHTRNNGMRDMESEHKCYTNAQQHKWHGCNSHSPVISYVENIRTGPQSPKETKKHGGQVLVNGWGLQQEVLKPRHLLPWPVIRMLLAWFSHPVVLEHLGHTLLLQECPPNEQGSGQCC